MQATWGTLLSLPSVCPSSAFPTRSQSVCPAPASPYHLDHPLRFSLFLLSIFSSTSCLSHTSWVFSLIFVIPFSLPTCCLSVPICCLFLFPSSALFRPFQLSLLLCRLVSSETPSSFLISGFFLFLFIPPGLNQMHPFHHFFFESPSWSVFRIFTIFSVVVST